MIALRISLLNYCQKLRIRPFIWSRGSKPTSSLVIIAIETACTEEFLEYAQWLTLRQQLDRIIIDEAHLTITANIYRPSMEQLGWYIRNIKTQSVWLTATLPPIIQETFIEQNKLVRPTIIRVSTNRPNLQYIVYSIKDSTSLIEKVKAIIQQVKTTTKWFPNPSKDRIIVYCRTILEVTEVSEALNCSSYTSQSGTAEEKAEILTSWLQNSDQPVIVATGALGLGFDYPSIRIVIHMGPPTRLTDFSQESGRAGRDGNRAGSVIVLPRTWKPQLDQQLNPEEEAVQLYLSGKFCFRGVLSQFLDQPSDWCWCIASDYPCKVCQTPNTDPRPLGLRFNLE
jgi:Superfamily II DNA helicase